jgi:hypothetical protein
MSTLLLSELSAIDAIADGGVTTTYTGVLELSTLTLIVEHSIVQRRTTAKALLSGGSPLRSQGFSLAPLSLSFLQKTKNHSW